MLLLFFDRLGAALGSLLDGILVEPVEITRPDDGSRLREGYLDEARESR
jgi:hypothetical protein